MAHVGVPRCVGKKNKQRGLHENIWTTEPVRGLQWNTLPSANVAVLLLVQRRQWRVMQGIWNPAALEIELLPTRLMGIDYFVISSTPKKSGTSKGTP